MNLIERIRSSRRKRKLRRRKKEMGKRFQRQYVGLHNDLDNVVLQMRAVETIYGLPFNTIIPYETLAGTYHEIQMDGNIDTIISNDFIGADDTERLLENRLNKTENTIQELNRDIEMKRLEYVKKHTL